MNEYSRERCSMNRSREPGKGVEAATGEVGAAATSQWRRAAKDNLPPGFEKPKAVDGEHLGGTAQV